MKATVNSFIDVFLFFLRELLKFMMIIVDAIGVDKMRHSIVRTTRSQVLILL